jgi:hypothetical protein
MLSCFILFPFMVPGELPIANEEPFPTNLYLVRGRAKSVVKLGPRTSCGTFKIEHVFLGPDSLKGRCFNAFKWPMDTDFAIGEVGIWWIVHQPISTVYKLRMRRNRKITERFVEEWSSTRRNFGPGSTFGRCRKSQFPDGYIQDEKIAQVIERVYRAEGARRIELLKQLCLTDDKLYLTGDNDGKLFFGPSFLVPWSMRRLERLLPKPKLIHFYKHLLETPHSYWTEELADFALEDLDPEWRHSEGRIKLFHRWMTSKLGMPFPNGDESSIIGHISGGSYYNSWHGKKRRYFKNPVSGLPFDRYLELIIDGLMSDRRSDEFKKDLENAPGWGPSDSASIDAGFAYLLLQLRKGTPERRATAARLLCCFAPFSKQQQTAVQKLLDDNFVDQPAPLIRAALDHTTRFWLALSEKGDVPTPESKPLSFSRLFSLVNSVFHQPIQSHRRVYASELYCSSMLTTQVVRALQERLRPSRSVDPVRVRQLIFDLDHDKFSRRESATRQLVVMGLATEPILRSELDRIDSPEVRRRLDSILAQFKAERRLTLRAIKILAIIETTEATKLLNRLASGSPADSVTCAAKKAIETRQKRDSDR